MKFRKIMLIPILLIGTGCSENQASSNGEVNSITSSVENTKYWDVNFYYNYEGNNNVFLNTQVEHDKKISRPNEPTREGYEFTNWYKDTYCLEPWLFTTDKVTAPTNLYAGWEKAVVPTPNTYTINWVSTEGVVYEGVNGKLPTQAEENTEVSFFISIDHGYEGTPIVTMNNETLSAVDGIYTFTVTTNIEIKVTGIKEIETLSSTYRITFTLPDFDPVAVNPRLYYWGSESISDSIFTLGATSNMTQLEGSTYYIDFDTSVTLEGLIIIFDQGNEVKQSFDITTNLPTEAGTYHINVPDWTSNGWKQNTYGVWCFVAELIKQ